MHRHPHADSLRIQTPTHTHTHTQSHNHTHTQSHTHTHTPLAHTCTCTHFTRAHAQCCACHVHQHVQHGKRSPDRQGLWQSATRRACRLYLQQRRRGRWTAASLGVDESRRPLEKSYVSILFLFFERSKFVPREPDPSSFLLSFPRVRGPCGRGDAICWAWWCFCARCRIEALPRW